MKGKRVLVIEDEDFLIRPLKFSLEKEGVEFLSAKDGEEGLLMVKSELPDLILLDLVLPKKNGFDVLAGIKNNPATKNIPVLIVSNLAGSGEVERGLAGGADDYFVKANLSISSLIAKIRTILEK